MADSVSRMIRPSCGFGGVLSQLSIVPHGALTFGSSFFVVSPVDVSP